MSKINEKLLIDIGSTYFKVSSANNVEQHFRDFNKDIYDDLTYKCGETLHNYHKDDVFICSSANGGLSTLIIGVTNSFSLKYATNIAFNSGINIIDTVLFQDIETSSIPSDLIDVVILAVTTVGASIGAPSTPGVGIIILATILQGLGVPPDGVALILGVDRILDMCRTTINVTGDLTASLVMRKLTNFSSASKKVSEELKTA